MPQNNYVPDDLDLPLKSTGHRATDEALAVDLETELSDESILGKFNEQTESRDSMAAQQALARSRAETAALQEKLGGLEQTNQTLMQGQANLEGQLSQITAQQTQATQAQQQAAHLAQFNLTEDELAAHGESQSFINKVLGKALYEQEQRLTQRFEQQLQQQTTAAVTPLQKQIEEQNNRATLLEQTTQNNFENDLNNAFSMRGTTFEAFLQDPHVHEVGMQPIPGLGKTPLQLFRENAAEGKLNEMMAFVDLVNQSRGFNPMDNAQVPSGNTSRVQTSAEHALVAKRTELENKLEAVENLNAVGDYSRWQGSKKKFMEERTKILTELENNPI